MPISAQAEQVKRCFDGALDKIKLTRGYGCTCRNPGDPDAPECRACLAWNDMAETVSLAFEQFKERANVDA